MFSKVCDFLLPKDDGPVERLDDDKCHINKEAIKFKNSAIGIVGPPGHGKSTFGSIFYNVKYDVYKNVQ